MLGSYQWSYGPLPSEVARFAVPTRNEDRRSVLIRQVKTGTLSRLLSDGSIRPTAVHAATKIRASSTLFASYNTLRPKSGNSHSSVRHLCPLDEITTKSLGFRKTPANSRSPAHTVNWPSSFIQTAIRMTRRRRNVSKKRPRPMKYWAINRNEVDTINSGTLDWKATARPGILRT